MKQKKIISLYFFVLTQLLLINSLEIRNLTEINHKYYMNNIENNTIPITMALDDGYIYPTVVAITSVMENANKNIVYEFYIMHSPKFCIENKKKLKSLERKYKNCKINLIDMTEDFKFKNASTSKIITTPSYYRLILPELLPNIHKIIYLDGDTLVLTDIKEMYNIDMENYYFKGFLDITVNGVDNFTLDNDHCICAGVMLINLDELRKDNMVNKMYKFMKENNDKLIQQDQTIINAVCYKKIGILPAKFGMFNFKNIKDLFHFTKNYRYKNKYSQNELKDAYVHPLILHYVNKPWKRHKNYYKSNLWWEYANKTDYYDEICLEYPYEYSKIVKIIFFLFSILLFLYLIVIALKKKSQKNKKKKE